MTWVHHTPPEVAAPHKCEPPEIEAPPPRTPPAAAFLYVVPAGGEGSLWRCDCGRLYRVGRMISGGRLRWLPATWWQRRLHRKAMDRG